MAEESLSDASDSAHGIKKRNATASTTERPRKRVKPFSEADSSTSDSEDVSGGTLLLPTSSKDVLNINESFARRFEHNKRREELHKLEEKYGKDPVIRRKSLDSISLEDNTDSFSDSEDEDDEGYLASGELDQQVQATLQAIKAKDPRVYDKTTAFYTIQEDQVSEIGVTRMKDKPMYLNDYHRENILRGVTDFQDGEPLPTYAQEQDAVKAAVVREINASTKKARTDRESDSGKDGSEDEGTNGEFLVPKAPESQTVTGQLQRASAKPLPDVESADKDPERFLSDYMSARAWLPQIGSKTLPFESDDEEEEKRAEEFEDAYNLRFEDPSITNEKLISHARDATARYSVRREATKGRKKTREIEKTRREMEKESREEDKARLRKLRIADIEQKIKKIKDTAGLRKQDLDINDWSKFLDEGWDNKRWEEEMQERFGDSYYADLDTHEEDAETTEGIHKVKKPKWKDDIHIGDILPDFEETEHLNATHFTLSDAESDVGRGQDPESEDQGLHGVSLKKQRSREKNEGQKQARKERRHIEQLVDRGLKVDNKLADMGSKHAGFFRYRETSPVAFGLSANDILMASDTQLNQYAGLKKLATFRDSTKKGKDRKRLGKKARLKQWRKETFGSVLGPQSTLADLLADQGDGDAKPVVEGAENVVKGSRRKKGSKRKGHVAGS
ncbi:MAG: hypothetical protein L6R37_003103 [Teloschistes peruensis]|nr:MAG: hypothetical protein L6R37_003103 [Teloschistes peruensis]